MDFAIFAWRFNFVAREPIRIPPGKAGNVFRGAFGFVLRQVSCPSTCPGTSNCDRRHSCSYARIFEPRTSAGVGPSGLADWPRPFVFRASHLDGTTIGPGRSFYCDIHLFLRNEPELQAVSAAFAELGRHGLGASRGTADLVSVDCLDINKKATNERTGILLPVDRDEPWNGLPLRVHFVTPTELKADDEISDRPGFCTVFARSRDRVATLSSLYGAGPLDIDFRGLGERARQVRLVDCDLKRIETERLSTRTGQRHPIGGFVGHADYFGPVGEFMPILKIAEWTGIGRQTVWGKGEIRCESLSPK